MGVIVSNCSCSTGCEVGIWYIRVEWTDRLGGRGRFRARARATGSNDASASCEGSGVEREEVAEMSSLAMVGAVEVDA